MLSMPFPYGRRQQINYSGRPSATMGTAVTSGGSANTLGSFAEIIASLDFDAFWISIGFVNTGATATNTSTLVNFYKGANGAEEATPFIPNILAGWSSTIDNITMLPRWIHFPLYIPAGTRISAKAQSAQLSKSVRTLIRLQGGGRPPQWMGTRVECLGANTGTSKGTDLTAGGASEGTFVNMGTTGPEWGYVMPMTQGNTDLTQNNSWGLVDIGVGDAQYRDLRDWSYVIHSSEHSVMRSQMGRFTRIPAGTTLQLRAQASGTAEARDWCLYGVY